MPNWNGVLNETKAARSTYDVIRRKYLRRLHLVTGRNIIAYYSGWLQDRSQQGTEVNDEDKNGLMTTIHKLDRTKGLDLVLHTQGGDIAATESLVDYLRSMFGTEHPGDYSTACHVGRDNDCLLVQRNHYGCAIQSWSNRPTTQRSARSRRHRRIQDGSFGNQERPFQVRNLAANYRPTLVGECQKAIVWSEQLVKDWLLRNMLDGDETGSKEVGKIVEELGNHALTLSHARHLSMERCKEIGLKIVSMEEDKKLQDAILSLHHACMHTLTATPAFKIIENHKGIAFIKIAQVMAVRG